MMQHTGWLLIIVGLIITGIGAVWLLTPHVPWLGELPGDIAVDRENLANNPGQTTLFDVGGD